MKNENTNFAAEMLFNSRIHLERISKLPKNFTPNDKNEAYAIQDVLIKKYLSADKNTEVIGKKVGCTNKTAQKQINVKEPFYGNLFSHYSSKSGCSLNIDNFFRPFIEPEFSFKIKKDLDISNAPYSSIDIYNNIVSVLPSIEIVDSRFKDWTKAGINNLIADNAVNAYWIYGNEIKNLETFNFSNHPITLYINNQIVEKGNAKNVLGNPINSLTWLTNTLASQGKTLNSGSYVSTGTCTAATPVNKGDKICADFGNLGKIDLSFK